MLKTTSEGGWTNASSANVSLRSSSAHCCSGQTMPSRSGFARSAPSASGPLRFSRALSVTGGWNTMRSIASMSLRAACQCMPFGSTVARFCRNMTRSGCALELADAAGTADDVADVLALRAAAAAGASAAASPSATSGRNPSHAPALGREPTAAAAAGSGAAPTAAIAAAAAADAEADRWPTLIWSISLVTSLQRGTGRGTSTGMDPPTCASSNAPAATCPYTGAAACAGCAAAASALPSRLCSAAPLPGRGGGGCGGAAGAAGAAAASRNCVLVGTGAVTNGGGAAATAGAGGAARPAPAVCGCAAILWACGSACAASACTGTFRP